MNYEEKYKEALEKAQIYRNHLIKTGDDTNEIEYIFPELINEDERIKKEILSVVKQFDKNTTLCGENYDYNKWITWLEKQGEQKYDVPDTPIKYSEVVTSRMKYIDENLKPIAEFVMDYANWDLRKDEWNHPVATVPLFRVLDALVQNGKQYSEEYSVVDNNTEQKFKVGDWITNGEYTWKVISIERLDYILQSQNGDTIDDTISYVDEHFHLWTIQDAKNGDVLYCDNGNNKTIYLFKEQRGSSNIANAYFQILNMNNELKLLFNKAADFNLNTKPATEEQLDTLFAKMKETGYTWDAETKQLIKKQS